MTEEKQIRINIRVDQQLKEEFYQYCKDNSLNGSDVVRKLIINWLQERKEKEV